MRHWLRRIAYLGHRSRLETERSRPEALAQVRRELGSAARLGEGSRAGWRFQRLEDLFTDLRYAARGFRRNPMFALTATACLALGIGANSTVFSIAMEVLFSQPSVRDAATLVHVRLGRNSHVPVRDYRVVREAGIFAGIAGENEETLANWRDGEHSSRVYVVRVTDDFFDVTGFPLALGRPIQPGEIDTVVLTHAFWQRRLGGAATIVGRKLVLDGQPYTVAGVLPKDHRTVTGFGFAPDLYAPVRDEKTLVALYGRIGSGSTRPIAEERLKTVGADLDRRFYKGNERFGKVNSITGVGGMDRIRVNRIMPLAIFFAMLLVVVALVLLIACANVASLLLARASSRSHEIAIRLSIGAGRGRLVRQLLAESLLLAVLGTGAGLALNLTITALLSRIQLPLPIPIQFLIQPDWRLLAYASAVALVTCITAGMAPALRSTRAGIGPLLKRGSDQAGPGRWTLRNVLVAGQLAVSIVLLSAGLLFVRNLLQATTTSPGFDIEHSIWSSFRLVPDTARPQVKVRSLVDEALGRLRTLPGVESASIARVVPLNNNVSSGMDIVTDLAPQAVNVNFKHNQVGADYFRTMQIPIIAGREFSESDRAGTEKVIVVNQALAQRLFGAVNPVGHVVRFDDAPRRIIGVAKNSKYFMLSEENERALYEAYAQQPSFRDDLHFLIRAAAQPQPLIPGINAALTQLDSTAAIETKPMSQALTFALLPSRFGAAVLGSMGLLGLTLAAIGLYGVLLYSVSRRKREIGLRVALGATPPHILRMVIGQSAILVTVGLAVGIALAVFAVRPLSLFLLPGVRPTEPANFLLVAAALSTVAVAATLAPAMRALRIDPMAALRDE